MEKKAFFGTTREMVIDQIEICGALKAIAIDARGLYLTTPDRVGKSQTDTNRSKAERHHYIRDLVRMGIDTRALFEENRHRIAAARCQRPGLSD